MCSRTRAFRLEKPLHFFLGPDEPFVGDVGATLATMLHETADDWHDWVRGLAIPLEWQDVGDPRRDHAEAVPARGNRRDRRGADHLDPGSSRIGRNWDYRYCWIRDAYYTVQALNRLGALDVLENYLGYLRNIVDEARGGHVQPLYGVVGRSRSWRSAIADGLAGYRGMGPVRVGNQPTSRSSTTSMARSSCPTSRPSSTSGCSARRPSTISQALEKVGERALAMYDQPDAGLWEFRTRTQRPHLFAR